jgi:prophage regulatory protein
MNMVLLEYSELRAKKGISFSKQHIWRLMKRGIFPRAIKPGLKENTWVEAEIDAYIEARMAARDARYGRQPQVETA